MSPAVAGAVCLLVGGCSLVAAGVAHRADSGFWVPHLSLGTVNVILGASIMLWSIVA